MRPSLLFGSVCDSELDSNSVWKSLPCVFVFVRVSGEGNGAGEGEEKRERGKGHFAPPLEKGLGLTNPKFTMSATTQTVPNEVHET